MLYMKRIFMVLHVSVFLLLKGNVCCIIIGMISFINGLCVILEHNMACVVFSLISFVSYTGLQNWSLTV